MKKSLFATLILSFIVFTIQAQKLNGTVIGEFDSFDYAPYSCSTVVNTPHNVFDGNLNNTYAACDRDNGWVGLDLGEPHVITGVAYCPRIAHRERLQLGMFEGANNPDFGDAIPIYMITDVPAENVLTKKTVSNSRAFRYVRYKGPADTRCNIAEVEFYGAKSAGDDSNLFQLTNLPTVIVHTVDEKDVVEKELYLKGIITVISENGTTVFTDSTEIRGRGNASWSFPKKPYRIKLYNKASLLGNPAVEKSWTLINNYGDKTLMRNLLAFDLSKKVELPYTPAGKPVDVILNGQYKGTYQLSDQIEVAKGRVEVEKMAKTTVALPDLAGGYFVEIDAYAYSELSWFVSAMNKIPVTIKYPKDDDINAAQTKYITDHFNLLESAVFSSGFTNPTTGYRKYLDTETFLRHFLVGELSGNTDTYWSVYMYKSKNQDKFYVGPVWDFDLAYENDSRTSPINSLWDWIYNTKGSTAEGVKRLVNRIMSDPQTGEDLKRIYSDYRDKGVISEESLLAVVNQYATELDQSQKLNFIRWPIMNQSVHQNPYVWGNYKAEVDNVRKYIKDRIKWIDSKLNYVPNSVPRLDNPNIIWWAEDGIIHLKGMSANANVQIYDITGRLNLFKTSDKEVSIPMEKGIYILKIQESEGMESTLKVVVK